LIAGIVWHFREACSMKNSSTKLVSAYPNFSADSLYAKPAYNLNKWIESMREIYTSVHFGNTLPDAFGKITANWDKVEKRDFQTWMQYYQGDNQNKYKKASNFYVNDNIPGYFLPNPNQPPSPIVSPDVSEPMATVQHAVDERVSKEEKRKKMEEQRKKIIGRLNAAVKHLTSHEGHLLAGEEFDNLLAGMYELIKQFQTVNKISLSNKLYYDLIIRQANKLTHGGFTRSAGFLVKFAQNNSGTKMDASGPLPLASADTSVAGGTLNNPTAPLDAMAPPGGAAPEPPEDKEDAIDELFDNLETAGLTDLNFSDEEDEDELDGDISLDDELSVEAQMAPPAPMAPEVPAPKPIAPPAPAQEPVPEEVSLGDAPEAGDDTIPVSSDNLEVSLPEGDTGEEASAAPTNNIDSIIDSALSNISIEDVIRKIEDVNAIFQNRTIARELSIIDLMLSNLGLSSYFNNLSEIIQKNHEGSNYSISRLSDILTKLRGATSDEVINIRDPNEVAPQVQQLQQKLQNEKDKDQNRKEQRKQLQNDELDTQVEEKNAPPPPTPELGVPTTLPKEEIANVPAQIV
jgi:hypothetical protein